MGTAFEDLCGIPGSLGRWWPVALLIDFSIGNVDVATSQPRTPLVGRAPLIGFHMEDDEVCSLQSRDILRPPSVTLARERRKGLGVPDLRNRGCYEKMSLFLANFIGTL